MPPQRTWAPSTAPPSLWDPELYDFLAPLQVTTEVLHELSREFYSTFQRLAAESKDMFLSTPISESILRPADRRSQGR